MRNLDGSTIAVIGANGGLGSAIGSELVSRGARIVGCGRSGPDVVLDIRDADAGARLLDEFSARALSLNGVVVASGIVAFGPLAETDPVTIEEVFLVNALGPLWLARSVLPALTQTSGFFAAITGVVAEAVFPGMVAYSASKAALSHGLAALGRETRRQGVHVLDARPPHTETGLADRPLVGTAPRMPTGLEPAVVARRIVEGIMNDESVLGAAAFA